MPTPWPPRALVDGIMVVVEARQTPGEDLMRMREMLAGYGAGVRLQ